MDALKRWAAGVMLALSTTAAAEVTYPSQGIVPDPVKRAVASGTQVLHPVRIDARSIEAAGPGALLALPGTGGRPVLARHERTLVHADGIRSWIGTVQTGDGPQSVVITFGPDAVFGVVPQAAGPALQLTTRQGGAFVVEGGTHGAPPRSDAVVAPAGLVEKSAGRPQYVLDPKLGNVPLVDVLVVYSAGVITRFGSEAAVRTRIKHLESISNQAYSDSRSDVELRIVHSTLVDYSGVKLIEQALSDLANPAGTPLKSQVDPIRVQYGADLVAILRDIDETAFNGTCGIANVGGFDGNPYDRSRAYGAIVEGAGCPIYTFTHEVGHNMGSAHDQETLDQYGEAFRGHFPYSRGHKGPGFTSIMGYAGAGQAEVGRLSNPRISECAGQPCGIADFADNARSHGNAAPTVSGYYATVVPVLPKLYIDNAEILEGDAGTRNLRFTVRLNQPAAADVRFDIATADASATAGSDYTARAMTDVTIAAGQSSASFDVAVLGDTVDEPAETLEVRLSNPVGGVEIGDGVAIGTIGNDDTTLTISDREIVEGDSGSQLLNFTVQLSVPTAAPVTFRFATVDGSALAGSDYVGRDLPGQSIPAGSTSASFGVVVNGDLEVEPDEAFTIRASEVVGAKVGGADAVATIRNDDTSLSIDDVELHEGDAGTTYATFTVTASYPPVKPVQFDIATVDGSARAGSDYDALSESVTLGYGQSSRQFHVPVHGDTTVEPEESFTLRLANVVGALVADGTGTAVIHPDDDTATVIRTLVSYPWTEQVTGLAHDGSGNLYAADPAGNVVRRITPEGEVTVVAGRGTRGFAGDGGLAVAAQLNYPQSLAIDSAGNLFIGESGRVRRVGTDGIISTWAGNGGTDPGARNGGDGGPARDAQLGTVTGLDFAADDTLYLVSDHRVRRVTPAGIIGTAAGGNDSATYGGDGGPATAASLYIPYDVAVGPGGDLYISDTYNNRIRHVDAEGIIRTIAGDGLEGFHGDGGPAINARIARPRGIDVDADGNVYFVDTNNARIRRIGRFGIIDTVAGAEAPGSGGDGAPATSFPLNGMYDVVLGAPGEFFLSQLRWIRRVGPLGLPGAPVIGIASAGDGEAVVSFQPPADTGGSHVTGYVVSATSGGGTDVDAFTTANSHRVVGLSNGATYRFVVRAINEFGTGDESEPSNPVTPTASALPLMSIGDAIVQEKAGSPTALTFTVQLNRPATDVVRFDAATRDGTATAGSDYSPVTINDRYIPVGAMATTFTVPFGQDSDAEPDESFVVALSDVVGATVVDDTATGTLVSDDFDALIDTLAGDGTATRREGVPAVEAGLWSPGALAVDAAGNRFVIDYDRVLRIDSRGFVSTFAGGGTLPASVGGLATFAKLTSPSALAVDAGGNVYVADAGAGAVHRVTPSGLISTVLSGPAGSSGCIAGFASPGEVRGAVTAMTFDGAGNLYLANRCGVMRLTPWGMLQPVAGGLLTGFAGDGGPATAALFDYPTALAFGPGGDLLVADAFNFRVRAVSPGGVVRTLYAVPSPQSNAIIRALAVDPAGDVYFALDSQAVIYKLGADGSAIRRIGTFQNGFSGDGGPAYLATIAWGPRGLAVDGGGNVLVSDTSNRRIRRVGSIRVPDAPVIGAATAGNAEATVSFAAPASDGGSPITGYEVASIPSGGIDADAGSTSLVRVLTGLRNGSPYRFVARAINAAGAGPWSSASNEVIPAPSALPTLRVGDVVLNEGDSGSRQAVFSLQLSHPAPAGGVVLAVATANRSATAGSDYVARTGSVTIPAGASAGSFAVTVLGDTQLEGNEIFLLRVTAATRAMVADGVGEATLRNDDVATVSIANATVAEGDEGTRTAAFALTLSRALGRDVIVDLETADGSAVAGMDYAGRRVAGLLIPAGETAATFEVRVNADRLPEGDERFLARITRVTGATALRAEAVGLIRDDDGVVPSLSVADAELLEGHAGSRNLLFTISMSEPAPAEVAVYAFTGDGDATPGEDYVPRQPTRIAFAPGQTQAAFAVGVLGDALPESDESFQLYLAAPSGAVVGDGTASGRIRDDEARLAIDPIPLLEKASGVTQTQVRVRVVGAQPTVAPITFSLASRDRTAVSSGPAPDFEALSSGPHVIPAGVAEFVMPVALATYGDTRQEPDELFELVLSDVSGATVATPAVRVTLLNDDPGPTRLSTVVGNGSAGYAGEGTPTSATMVNYPRALVADAHGNLYFSDGLNHRVRQFAPDGTTRTIAGNGTRGFSGDGGPATEAMLNNPHGLAFDAQGNLYIADQENERIRKVAPDGTITTVAGNGVRADSPDGGLATESSLQLPRSLAVLADGRLLVTTAYRIRAIGTDGRFAAFAGGIRGNSGDGGPATEAQLGQPEGMAVGPDGALYVADSGNYNVRRIAPDGTITRVVGRGYAPWQGAVGGVESYLAGEAYLGSALSLAFGGDGSLFIGISQNRVLQLTPGGVIFPLAGNGSPTWNGEAAPASGYSVSLPAGLLAVGGELYIADTLHQRIRRVTLSELPGAPTQVQAVAGNAAATVTFSPPADSGTQPILAYEVESSPAGGIDAAAGTDATSREITGLQNGVSYTFSVRARSQAGTGAPSRPSNAVVPFDPDQPVLTVAPVSVPEGDAGNRTAVFELRLSKGSLQPVTFDVATVAATATAGSDYVAMNAPGLQIPPGQTSARVAVLVRGDTLVETDETFRLRVSNIVGASPQVVSAIATVRNDDRLKLSVADVAVTEGDAGTKTATFTVRLSQPAPAEVRYSIATANGTAAAGSDYVARALTGQAIAAGARSRAFAVTVNGDAAVEPDETFRVLVSSVSGAVVEDGEATGTILNDDQAPLPTLSIDDVAVQEGNSGTKQAVFTVRLSAPAPAPVTFAVATADGSAVAGSDYVAKALGGQAIAAGAQTLAFAVVVNGDTGVEEDEVFSVAVTGVSGATVADGVGKGTILDDDAVLPVLAARHDRVVLRENASATTIAVLANDVFEPARLAGGSLSILSVASGTATVVTGGTATAADDRIRYAPKADASGSDSVAYRLCETDGRCVQARLALELRPALDVEHATASGAGFVDVPVSGLRPLPAASFAATPLVAPVTVVRPLGVDASPETPWNAAMAGTAVVASTLPAPADGQPQSWRVLVDARGAGDVDLYLGLDVDGDGAASPGEVRCTAAMSQARERCEMALAHPGTGTLRYWVMLHNRDGAPQTATAEVFAVPLTGPTGAFAATGPGGVPRGASFPVRAFFDDRLMLPGEARAGYVRVRSGGVDTGLFPVRLDRTGTRAPAIRLASAPVAMRLPAGGAQDRMFIDVPAGATSLTVTTGSAQNIDLYLVRAASPSSPQIDPAPERTLATASATGATGNETLTVSGAQLQPGRWYVTPVNAGATPAWVSLRATIAGSGPVLRFGSFFNPARSGHGIFLYPAGGDWAGLWYTYLQDGSPTWYYVQGAKPGVDGIFTGGLYRAAWQGTVNHLTQVGDVRITPSSPDAFAFSYQLDGETGSETMTSLGRGCPMLGGLPLDVSSHWFNPARSGTGYSVQLWPDYEYYAAFVYDGHGVPRFLTAERSGFGGTEATMDLEQLTGFCPLCTRTGNPVRQSIGVFSRRFGGGTIENISLDGIYAAGVPGAWSGNEAVQTLGGPGTTQGCAP